MAMPDLLQMITTVVQTNRKSLYELIHLNAISFLVFIASNFAFVRDMLNTNCTR
jgi:hypothetical protein